MSSTGSQPARTPAITAALRLAVHRCPTDGSSATWSKTSIPSSFAVVSFAISGVIDFPLPSHQPDTNADDRREKRPAAVRVTREANSSGVMPGHDGAEGLRLS